MRRQHTSRRRLALFAAAVLAAAPLARAATFSFTNSAPITINDNAAASVYPSSIAASGFAGGFVVTEVNLILFGFSHTLPQDVDAMLVGPTGTNLLFLSDAGGSTSVSGLNLTIRDPFPGMTAPLASQSYAPTNIDTSTDVFPAPAPAPSANTLLSAFNQLNPVGTWDLFVRDDSAGSSGSISGGWELKILGDVPVTLIDNKAPTSTSNIALIVTPIGGTTTANGPATVATLSLQAGSAINIIPSPNPLELSPVARLAATSGWVTAHPGGASSITGGELRLSDVQNPGTFTTHSDLTVSSRINSLGLVKRGSAALILSGSNIYTGPTTLEQGTLRLGASGVIPDSSDVTISGSSILDVNGKTERVRSIASNSTTAQITLGSGMLQTGGGSTSFAGNVSGSGGKLIHGGGGTLTLSGANTHTGGTEVQPYGGTLRLTNADTTQAVPATGQLQLNVGGYIGAGGATVAASQANFISRFAPATDGIAGLEADTSSAFDFSVVFAGGSQVRLGTAASVTYSASSLTPQGSTYFLGGGGGTMTLSATNVLTGSRNIDIGTSGNLLPGQVNIGANQNYSGTTTISAGTASIASLPNTGSASPIGTGAAVTTIGGSDSGRLGVLVYTGATTTSNRNFVLGGDGGGIAVAAGGTNLELTGILSGGPLVKLGDGTLTLDSGLNSYTGTVVSAGTLSTDSDVHLGSTGAGGGIVLNGGVLNVRGVSAVSTSRAVELANTSIAGGFHITNLSTTGLTLNSAITGTGGWFKTGPGTLTLNAAGNDYNGTTAVQGGNVINTSGSEIIPNLSRLHVESTATLTLNGTSETIGSLTGTLTGTISLGSGNLTVGANNTNAQFQGSITGSGNLLKTGLGSQGFGGTSSNSSFTGTTTIQSGTLTTFTAAVLSGVNGPLGNSASAIQLGDAGVGADAALLTTSSSADAIQRPINIVSGAGLRVVGVASTGFISGAITLNKPVQLLGTSTGGISGVISDGGGGFGVTKIGGGTLSLTAGNTYSGSTTVTSGTLQLSGASGAIGSTSAVNVNDLAVLSIVQSTTPITRINTTAPFTLTNGQLAYTTAAAGSAISETFGTVSAFGFNPIIVSGTGPVAGTSLNFGALTRNSNASLFFQGAMGGTPGASTVNVKFPSALATISDPDGPIGGQNTAVIPFAGAHSSASASRPNTLATYDADGVLILSPTSATFFNQVTTGSPTFVQHVNNNIADSVTVSVSSPMTINSLAVSSTSTATLSGSSTLKIHSGAASNDGGIFVGGPTIDFGSNTGYLHVGNNIVVDGTSRITGSAGVVVSSRSGGALSFLDTNTAASNFTGGLFINGNAAVAFTNNNQLGDTSGAITLNGGKLISAGVTSLSTLRSLTLGPGGGGFGVASSFTFTVPHDLSGTGSLMKDGIGALVLTGINTYSGTTTITDGTLRVTDVSKLGTGPINLNGGTLATTTTHSTNRRITLSASSTISVAGLGTPIMTITSPIDGAGALTKVGTGILALSGPHTYSGTTTVNSGTFTLNAGATILSPVVVNSGGALSGSGTVFDKSVTLNSGAMISPGASPGTMTTGEQTWSGGATYVFEVNDAAGTSGASPGWDRINMSTLSITSTANSRFTIRVVGLSGSTPGAVANFNANMPAVFEKIATFVNDIRMTFDLATFAIDTTQFDNNNSNFGGFYLRLTNGGRSLDLVYVPEPGAGTVVLCGAAMLLRRLRRR